MSTNSIIGDKIAYYRKLNFLTQEQLAEALGISCGAVSKWEQKISCPDIMILPKLADIFQISIDELFGRTVVREPIFDYVSGVPWADDNKIRIALYHGKKLMSQAKTGINKGNNQIKFHFDYTYRINGVCNFVCE